MASGNIKNFELKLGKTGLAIIIVGTAVLLCSAFLFGIVVGKNIDTYPEKIASLPQRLLALVWRPAQIRVAQNEPKKPDELDLTFYKSLTSKKGVAQEQPIPDKKPVVEVPALQQFIAQPQNDAGSASIKPNPEVKKQQALTTGGTTGDAIEDKIKEAKPAVVAGGGKFSVQVASLKEKTKAEQMNKKISALGFTPQIVETNVQGKGTWFRVVIYGFSSKALAKAAAGKISNKTGTTCIVRRIDTTNNNN
jgi:cell division protein FtsN